MPNSEQGQDLFMLQGEDTRHRSGAARAGDSVDAVFTLRWPTSLGVVVP